MIRKKSSHPCIAGAMQTELQGGGGRRNFPVCWEGMEDTEGGNGRIWGSMFKICRKVSKNKTIIKKNSRKKTQGKGWDV